MRSSFRFTCVDVIAITLVTGVVATIVGAAGVSKAETANRVKCASNLKQLGLAIMLYSNENRGAYPRTTVKPDGEPTWGTPYKSITRTKEQTVKGFADPFADKVGDTGTPNAAKPAANDVTAALFLLLRTEDLVPEAFVCPSTTVKPFDYGGKDGKSLEWTNFPGKEGIAKHLSYSYQNPYPSSAAISMGFKLNNSLTAEFAVMSDMNPGVDALLKATVENAPQEEAELTAAQRALNSLNHQGEGQNVLYGDGAVRWVNNPFVGVKRDNIFVANDPAEGRKDKKAAFAISPVDPNDSILLPTAAAVGQKPGSSEKPIVVLGDPAAAVKPLLGSYTGKLDNKLATITIDDKAISMTSGPMTMKYDYRVLGQRDKAIVVELTAPQTPAKEMELSLEGQSLIVDGKDAPFPAMQWTQQPAK